MSQRQRQLDPLFLGVDCGHLFEEHQIKRYDRNGDPDRNLYVKTNTGVAVVAPAWKLVDLLNCQRLVEHRKEMEKQRIISDL